MPDVPGAAERFVGLFVDKGGAVYNAAHPDFGSTFDSTVVTAALAKAQADGGGLVFVPGTVVQVAMPTLGANVAYMQLMTATGGLRFSTPLVIGRTSTGYATVTVGSTGAMVVTVTGTASGISFVSSQADPGYQFDGTVLATRTEGNQYAALYDINNYMTITVGLSGIATFNAVGSAHAFVFSDPVSVTGAMLVTGSISILPGSAFQFLAPSDAAAAAPGYSFGGSEATGFYPLAGGNAGVGVSVGGSTYAKFVADALLRSTNLTETTGAGTALLGTNSPAVTLSAPYTWLKFKSDDGSIIYVPGWK